jgi:phenylpropionate dioxygenase-like ring-hydroxylating dioxygenase large terminal subunit
MGASPAGDDGPLLTNVDGSLARAWHPVALVEELPTTVTLLGRQWRIAGTGEVEPAPHGLCVRWGLVWLAPSAPVVDLFDDPDAEDAGYVGAWLPPVRTGANAGFVADNFLDVAHFPFVHAGTFGAGEEKVVPAYGVVDEPWGFRSVQDQWFDNPEDPGVAAGLRPVRQRRRATYVYRAPFQLLLRLAELDAGAVKTILFFVQPETLTSTRIYTKMLLHGIGGVARPGPEVVAREVAFEEAVLAEDLALQEHVTLPGLPLSNRAELHVRADRLGVALRRELRRMVTG